jgi:putative membrane protein
MKLKSKRYLNINVALKILLLLGFAFFFLNSVVTGSVSLYVHPRIIPYLIFAAVVMVIIALLLMGNLFNPQKQKVKFVVDGLLCYSPSYGLYLISQVF